MSPSKIYLAAVYIYSKHNVSIQIVSSCHRYYRYTVGSDNSLYGIVLNWFNNTEITLGAFKNTSGPHSIKMLGYNGKYIWVLLIYYYSLPSDTVHFTMGPDGAQVELPITDLKWAVTLKIET